MQPKNIFFDFDGVLLDTIEAKGRAISKPFEKYGVDICEKVYQYHLSNGGMNRKIKVKNCFKELLNFEIQAEELELFLKIISEEMNKELYRCTPVAGSLEFMSRHFCNKGRAWIVSAAPQKELEQLSIHFGFSKFVEAAFGYPNIKSEMIAKIISNEKLDRQSSILIGDAKEDYFAASTNGIPFLLRRTSHSTFSLNYTGASIENFTEADARISLL